MNEPQGTQADTTPSPAKGPERTPSARLKAKVKAKAKAAKAGRPASRHAGHRAAHHVASGLAILFAICVVALVVLGGILMGRAVDLPDAAVLRIEAQINDTLQDRGLRVELGGAAVGIMGDSPGPTIQLNQISLRDETGLEVLRLPRIDTRLDTSELIMGQAAPETINLRGAEVQLIRALDGSISLGIGGMVIPQNQFGGLDALFDRIDAAFALPTLNEMETLSGDDLSVTFRDMRSGQVLALKDGTVRLTRNAGGLGASLDAGLAMTEGGADAIAAPTRLHLSLEKASGASGAELVAKFSDLPARALAGQVSALSFLSVLEAGASGALTAQIDGSGHLAGLAGALNLGAGRVDPGGTAAPIAFDAARAYMRYDAERGRLVLDEVRIEAPKLTLAGTGHMDLRDFEARVPQVLLGQFRFSEVRADFPDLFDAEVAVERAALDVRYRPALQSLEIGQVMLALPGGKVVARGEVTVDEGGWRAALDARISQIGAHELLALWPKGAKMRTRAWLSNNIEQGQLSDVYAALRLAQGQPARQSVNFNFTDATVRYLRAMPPIENGRGYGVIRGNRFLLNLYSGQVVPANGIVQDVSGSLLDIPDMSRKPASLEVDLRLRGDMQGTLSLLDNQPFGFLSRSNLSPQMVTGRAEVLAQISVPLKPRVTLPEVGYSVAGVLRDVRSEVLVPGRVLTAERLQLTADLDRLAIGGQGAIDGVPIDAEWRRALGPGSGGASQVEGTVALSASSLRAFGVALPDGAVSGRGEGAITVALATGTPPQLALRSDLRGLGLRLDALNWSKSVASEGSLSLDMRLGAEPQVERLRLTAPGLEAKGAVRLRPGGGLERADFAPLRVEGRLNSRVSLIGRGAGRPVAIALSGGTADLRRIGGGGGGGRPGGGEGSPLEIALDRLVVSDGITLEGFRGDFTNSGGLSGDFRASANGAAPVRGTVAPTAQGAAVRIRAEDAGAVLRASEIFRNARGGAMDLSLRPTGRPGEFRGALAIQDTRMINAPAMAGLLSAISVVGLLEQLSQEGIPFSTVEADFVLSPSGVTLRSSSAVGASMGITMDGIYDTRARAMDMQGVISPLYAVNGLFGALFAPRSGEGLFGFNYTLKGSADAPQVSVNPLSMFTPGIFREFSPTAAPFA